MGFLVEIRHLQQRMEVTLELITLQTTRAKNLTHIITQRTLESLLRMGDFRLVKIFI